MVGAAAFTGTDLNLLGEFSQAQVILPAIAYLGRNTVEKSGHATCLGDRCRKTLFERQPLSYADRPPTSSKLIPAASLHLPQLDPSPWQHRIQTHLSYRIPPTKSDLAKPLELIALLMSPFSAFSFFVVPTLGSGLFKVYGQGTISSSPGRGSRRRQNSEEASVRPKHLVKPHPTRHWVEAFQHQ